MSFIYHTIHNTTIELARLKQHVQGSYIAKLYKLTLIELKTMELGFDTVFESNSKFDNPDAAFNLVIKELEPALKEAQDFYQSLNDVPYFKIFSIKCDFLFEALKKSDEASLEFSAITCRSALRLMEVYLATYKVTHDFNEAMLAIDPKFEQVELEANNAESIFTFFHEICSRIVADQRKSGPQELK